ncbi:hypothetical protein NIES2119_31830 [[Phormidium ambiguum] IAM M-71]|uniref:ATP-binding protein n=1 Tax=[Phormidium ambiguum] IAM M-71 TaxID=454136 RepID=A0A1U7I1P1_9CYAN|nr:ATP-binding protein [Phormidium ambiguum]OKH29877.1 hypothetical protein NIES2119_31830 [Phormidium ambiguum IAM M-71]
MGFRASEWGKKQIELAREKKRSDSNAKAYEFDDALLVEASRLLDPEKNWCQGKNIYADGCSIQNWKRFRTGKDIGDEVFKAFCKVLGLYWRDIVDYESNSQLQKSVDRDKSLESFWIGRKDLIDKLSTKLRGNHYVLVLTGLTGIGKTSLGYQLAKALQTDNFKRIIRVNFECYRTTDFAKIAADELLPPCGENVTPQERKDPEKLLDKLLKILCNNPYLLQMDSLENLLKGDENTGWNNFQDEWWVTFFQKLLIAPECQSRLILTSQDLPNQFKDLSHQQISIGEGVQLELEAMGRWYFQPVTGLNHLEQLELFKKTGIEIDLTSGNDFDLKRIDYLERIGAAYEGHPQALRWIAFEIWSQEDGFAGDVEAYWNKYSGEIEKIEKATQEIKRENDQSKIAKLTDYLKKKQLEKLLKRQIDRLKASILDAYRLLCVGSAYRKAVPKEAWFCSFKDKFPNHKDEQLDLAFNALFYRSLVEIEDFIENKKRIRLHNLVRSVVLSNLPRRNSGKPQDDKQFC